MFPGPCDKDAVVSMSEKAEIKRIGGTAQKNSGRGKIQKGDARLGPFVYDIKEYAEGFTVSRKAWAKACTDAAKVDVTSEAALQLVLGNPPIRLWVVSEDMFMEMLKAWQNQ
jgi:hypothetical protein